MRSMEIIAPKWGIVTSKQLITIHKLSTTHGIHTWNDRLFYCGIYCMCE